jgi:hypothetical protein
VPSVMNIAHFHPAVTIAVAGVVRHSRRHGC